MLDPDQQLKTLGDLTVRAKLHFDLWTVTKHQDSRAAHQVTFDEYWNYLRFNREAHEQKFLVILAGLISNARKDSVGVFQSIDSLQAGGHLSNERAEELKAKILTHKDVRNGIILIRNKLLAHRDIDQNYELVWRKANLTINGIGQLIDVLLDVVNDLLEAMNFQMRVAFSDPIDEFERLLRAARPRVSNVEVAE